MEREVFHVVLDGDQWALRRQNGPTVSQHGTKDAAVKAGQSQARANQPSQVVVHHSDGTIEDESTYQQDPYPPSG